MPSAGFRIPSPPTGDFKDRPETTFGTVNAGVPAPFMPGFQRIGFAETILTDS
ncbi:hypothetical protein ACWD48_18370 [Streptomyces sp. NPDC002519]